MILYIIAIGVALIAVFATAFNAREINELTVNMQKILVQSDEAKKQAIVNKAQIKRNADDTSTCLISIKGDIAEANRQIDDIVARMEKVVEEIRKVDKNEREIRGYYCNFRQPVNDGAGVLWAEDYKCEDD